MVEVEIVKTGKSSITKALNSERNIYQFAWNKVFTEIKSSLTDPKVRNEVFVFGQNPSWNITDSEFGGEEIKLKYPIVCIENPTISDFENSTLDYQSGEYSVNLVIDIFSDRSDYLDRLSDDVLYILLNNVQTNTSAGLHNMQILNDSYQQLNRSGVSIHNRTFTIRFDVVR